MKVGTVVRTEHDRHIVCVCVHSQIQWFVVTITVCNLRQHINKDLQMFNCTYQ